MTTLALPAYAQLSDADEASLTDLYRRSPPPTTLRAWERDLACIAALKMASFGRPLDWPEDKKVALCFILDHAQDLTSVHDPRLDPTDAGNHRCAGSERCLRAPRPNLPATVSTPCTIHPSARPLWSISVSVQALDRGQRFGLGN